jgi:hypothetical protein
MGEEEAEIQPLNGHSIYSAGMGISGIYSQPAPAPVH